MHSSATRLRPTGSRVDDSFLARSFQLRLRRPELLALAARLPSLAGAYVVESRGEDLDQRDPGARAVAHRVLKKLK